LSKTISRQNDVSRVQKRLDSSISAPISRWLTNPPRKSMSTGPEPTAEYAIDTEPFWT
jgi:hypothetical protein